MISQGLFISLLERLRQQHLQDKEYVDGLIVVFGTESFSMYDNSQLVDGILEVMSVGDDEFREIISDYCYVHDFGNKSDFGSSLEFYLHLKNLWDLTRAN